MEKILATIITYNPTSLLEENISMLINQVDSILIVDNSTNPDSQEYVNSLTNEVSILNVISNNGNKGIATALNTSLDYAKKHNYKWLITFDQDSKPTENFVKTLLKGYKEHPDNALIAIVGPSHLLTDHEITEDRKAEDLEKIEMYPILTTMTSGNLVNVELLSQHGISFKDEYFIDYVDHEICLNISDKGLLVMQCDKAILLHNLGEISTHRFLNKNINTTNHNYIRRYYITRNRLMMYKNYYKTQKKWVLKDAREFFIDIFRIVFFEKDKFPKIKSIFWGMKDMLTNNMGEIKK